eukprot:SAG11_NODE_53_length_19648_cov_14.691902_22_plen_279_part_00
MHSRRQVAWGLPGPIRPGGTAAGLLCSCICVHICAVGAPEVAEPPQIWGDGTVTRWGTYTSPDQLIIAMDNRKAGDKFGSSLAMNRAGTRLVVGATGRDDAGSGAGAAMIYDKSWCSTSFGFEYSCWVLSGYFLMYTGFMGGGGSAVAMSADGEVALVGALGDGWDGAANAAGSAFVYSIDARTNQWRLNTKLGASDKLRNDFFGCSVAMKWDGSVLVVGAYGKDTSEDLIDAGAAYVYFSLEDGGFREQRLTAHDGAPCAQATRPPPPPLLILPLVQ